MTGIRSEEARTLRWDHLNLDVGPMARFEVAALVDGGPVDIGAAGARERTASRPDPLPNSAEHRDNLTKDSCLASLVECPHSSLAVNVDCHDIAVLGCWLPADDYPVTVGDR